jgi:hypothetical protein
MLNDATVSPGCSSAMTEGNSPRGGGAGADIGGGGEGGGGGGSSAMLVAAVAAVASSAIPGSSGSDAARSVGRLGRIPTGYRYIPHLLCKFAYL